MMKELATALVCILLCLSCRDGQTDRTVVPHTVLQPDSMAALIADFCLAESAANLNIKAVPLEKNDSVYGFDPLAQHGVRKSLYDSSLEFYAAHPLLYRAIYDSVLVRLDRYKMTRKQVLKPANP